MDQESKELQKRLEKLELLLEVNRELVLELDLDRLLVLVVERTTRVMDADRSSLYVVDRDKGEIWTRVAQGVEEIRLPLGKGIAGRVAETGESTNVGDAYTVAEFDPTWDQKHRYVTRSMLCIPLRGRHGDVIGVFEVLNKRHGVFDQEDEDLLTALGAGVAIAVENAVLVDELKQVNRKVTDTYEQLLQSEKLSMLGLLAGTVAHDIQNPMEVILSYAEALMRKFPHQAGVMQSARTIMEQVERVSELVESVQNFSRKGSSEFGEVDLHRVLRESLMLTERLLVKGNIEVERRYERDLPFVWGNTNRLEQVFMNLIQNAAQAMDGAGTLKIATRRLPKSSSEQAWVEVAVSDTAGGIPQGKEGRIFEAFYTTKSEGKGTGLGLSICRRIVEEHKGEIQLQNRPGNGATFLVRLPTAGAE